MILSVGMEVKKMTVIHFFWMQHHSNLLLLMNDNVMYWENWSERGFFSLKAAPLNSNLEFGL